MSDSSKNLRPYYDPETFNTGYPTIFRPGVGVIDENGNTIASKISKTSINSISFKKNNNVGLGGFGFGKDRTLRNMAKVQDYNENIQKNMYSDLEFSEYFDWNNVGELIRSLVNSFVKNYIRCLIAQPFEVARLLLQIGDFQTLKSKPQEVQANEINAEDDDDEEDEPDYFQPKSSNTSSQIIHSKTRTIKKQTSTTSRDKNNQPRHYLKPVSLNTIDVIASLSSEGIRGVWRATNATFILNALSSTLEAWITGFISPFLQIPDPFFVDVTHSPDPTTTLLLSLSASVLTALLLAPLDLIRTKMIVTSVNGNERSIRNSIKNLKFFTIPVSLILPTVLHSLSNNFFKKFTPYLLYVKFGIDSIGSPTVFGTISLISSVLELFIKLPIETLLRRAQVSYLLKNSSTSDNLLKISSEDKLIVKFGGYSGIWTTLYNIYYGKNENRGFEGLFRGWRVGILNIVGSGGLNVLQNSYDDQIFKEEKF